MEAYILAHDLGTSGNKAVLYRADGTLAASALYAYETGYPHEGWVEQDPEDWWRAVCLSTQELLERAGVPKSSVLCVSFSAQMMGCLPVDRQGTPLRPMITWADTRAQKQERQMVELLGMDTVYRVTGHRPSASYTAAKLLWIRENEPEVYAHTHKVLHAKDFIIHRLTGRFVTDYSDASGTNLFDLEKKAWSAELCAALDIPLSALPEAYPSAHVAGGVTEQAAAVCGLSPGTPVVIGGGDGSCACVGAGVVAEGRAYCVLGSSSWISTASRAPVYDPAMRTFNWVHLDPALYTPCGTMQAAGLSYNWLRGAVCGEECRLAQASGQSAYRFIDELVRQSPPGACGVLFLPYLLGERSPHWNHAARAAFLGMDAATTKAELARAVLEGVGYNLRIILEILDGRQPVEGLTLIGGGAKGRLWGEILADIWQKPLAIPVFPAEATNLGAAVCGGVGIGMFADYSAVSKFNPTKEIISPNRENAGRYDELYHTFCSAYEALRPVYGELANYRAAFGLRDH